MIPIPSSSGFQPLDREGLVQRVARLLGKAIITGQLAPGARLSESVVARDLGVSRAPVREAARLLENSGLVTYHANRGFFVRKISAEELDHLYELRIVIELAAARRMIDQGQPEPVAALAAQLQALHRVAAPGVDMLTQVEADMQFHRLLCSGSGNPKFLAVFDQIAAETEFSIMVIGQLYDDPLKMAETHEPILDALQAGDAPRAEAAIRYHIGVAREMVTRQFRDLETGAG
ncbi:GntR family transcriptional regulator [Salipiger marinus]|jgi:DNA-binding GntR family transcriptional regulator|uniref:Transcriptional regulator, GntR family n=1 Tax=Salipiger marinus TaxID=555512 RepID=A0A1G8SMJ4_9RHOB|nr:MULTISPECIES: GntR family transcriptional regulator [Salipiger]MEB3420709.1 GntR family transcriptional regulator [Salipiger manganoxidans]SDJ30383.1 transcriptional regulator, GntR family [Salipiger marinus]HBM57858.1 GntR family transcriptional regulator [Citreicella sp.]HBT02081.1 GntR family transcriptional regulator [Citreicella sp.]